MSIPEQTETPQRVVRFGAFEVDLLNGELRKLGSRLRLQEQPFQVLAALLEQPGEIVPREELVRRLWQDGTVVDYDRGLNAAVTRLRQVLSDSAESPRYVETVARRGYRFIAKLDGAEKIIPQASGVPVQRLSERRNWIWPTLVALAFLCGGFAWWSMIRKPVAIAQSPLRVVPLTTDPGFERNASFSPSGDRVAYEWDKGNGDRHIYIKLIGPGDPIQLTTGPAPEYGPAWSHDGRFIAFLRRLDQTRMGAFIVPALGGVEREIYEFPPPGFWVLNNTIRRLDWTPDDKYIVLSGPEKVGGGDGLFAVAIENGTKIGLTTPPADPSQGDRAPAVSADGHNIAFVRGALLGAARIYLLPISADQRPSGEPRLLTDNGQNPQWMPNDKEVLFTSSPGLWKVGVETGAVRQPVNAEDSVALPAVAKQGKLVYTRSTDDLNMWVQEIPPEGAKAPSAVSLIASTAADMDGQYSPDGQRIAFQSARSGSIEVWVCSNRGVHCYQLTAFNGPAAGSPSWSPDGSRIAFDCPATGNFDIYVINANGGSPKRLTSHPGFDAIPNWSRDGR